MNLVVRRADTDDVSAIADLYAEVADEVVEREPTFRHVPDRGGVERRYKARIGEADRCIFVAVADGTVVGFADVTLHRNTDETMYHAPGLDAYVEELVVTATSRRLGIGTSLMTTVEAWAHEAGARLVRLDTHVSNRAARELYAAVGYGEFGVILAKDL